MSEPRSLTSEELRDQVLELLRGFAYYWATVDGPESTQERIEGAIFSTLVLFDGESHLPRFDLVARPHPDDKDYDIESGNNWIEDGTVISDLHNAWAS